MSMIKRGAFILVEGLDRCGKSSQTKMLKDYFGEKAELIGFPNRSSAIGKLLNDHLTRKSEIVDIQALHLLFVANRFERKKYIEQTLLSGVSIICDRYSFSGSAYSVAQGLSSSWCWNPEIGLPAPDLVLFLKLSPEEAKLRSGYGEEVFEKVEFQSKVASAFEELRLNYSGNWTLIDAGQSMEKVFEDVRTASIETIKKVETIPISYF